MGPMEEASIAYVLRGVLTALAYLHGQARIHRDLKAANVLLSSSAAVKVCLNPVSACVCAVGTLRRPVLACVLEPSQCCASDNLFGRHERLDMDRVQITGLSEWWSRRLTQREASVALA